MSKKLELKDAVSGLYLAIFGATPTDREVGRRQAEEALGEARVNAEELPDDLENPLREVDQDVQAAKTFADPGRIKAEAAEAAAQEAKETRAAKKDAK